MLTDLNEIDIKELSMVYDSESRETFVSLYLNFDKRDEKFIEKRRKACRAVLKEDADLLRNFDKTMQRIEEYIHANGREHCQKALAIFASDVHSFFRTHKLGVPVEDLMVVDASPYIRPLVELTEDHEKFGLVILDSHRARIYVVSSGMIEDRDKLAEHIMNRHKKGGMSQARFQRLRQGAIGHFMKEVSDEMVKLFSKDHVVKIVVAGPGNAKTMLKESLPNELRSEILDTMDADFDEADASLVSRADEAVLMAEKETVSRNIARLNEEILKHGLAVHGLQDVIDAVKNGQVELLLVCRDYKPRGWICERCQIFGPGTVNECPNCRQKVSEIDVIEEIIELAERTDAKTEFVEDNPVMRELEGVGGLLRFKR